MKKVLYSSLLFAVLFLSCGKDSNNPVIPTDPLKDKLIAYYPFDGNTGDYSGGGLNGIPAALSYGKDRNNKDSSAANFNGVNAYVKVAHNQAIEAIQNSNEATFAAWVYIRNWYQGWNIFNIICQWDSLEDKGWEFGFGARPTAVMSLSGADWAYSATLNKWIHAAVTITAADDSIRFYIDGIKIGTKKKSAVLYKSTYGPLYIGFSPFGPDEYSNGLIDELYIYNRRLSNEEIKQIYLK